MYKFVCDPEALLTLGLGGGDNGRRSGHDPSLGGSLGTTGHHQHDRRTGFRVLPHSYYTHHRTAASYAGKLVLLVLHL